jgi:hypothetical protein
VLDAPPTVTVPPGVPPAWDPAVPRRPPRWPAVVALAVTALVVAGGFAVLIAGLRVRYTERADKCAALDVGPVARVAGRPRLDTFPQVDGFDCRAAVGDDPRAPAAVVGLSMSYRDSAVEARLAYEASDEADGPGTVALPGGKRGRLVATPARAGPGCVIRAVLQDVNLVVTAQLSFDDQALKDRCRPTGAAAQALASTMRATLAGLA